jgi:hypothetical protein
MKMARLSLSTLQLLTKEKMQAANTMGLMVISTLEAASVLVPALQDLKDVSRVRVGLHPTSIITMGTLT